MTTKQKTCWECVHYKTYSRACEHPNHTTEPMGGRKRSAITARASWGHCGAEARAFEHLPAPETTPAPTAKPKAAKPPSLWRRILNWWCK